MSEERKEISFDSENHSFHGVTSITFLMLQPYFRHKLWPLSWTRADIEHVFFPHIILDPSFRCLGVGEQCYSTSPGVRFVEGYKI